MILLFLLACASYDKELYAQHFYKCLHAIKVDSNKHYHGYIREESIEQCRIAAKEISMEDK